MDAATERGIVLHMAKNAISVVARTTSAICARSQSVTPGGQNGPMKMESVPIDVHEICECQNDMDDLSDQVQSLFYS